VTPSTRPRWITTAQLYSRASIASGAPTIATTASSRDAATTSASARPVASSSACWWNRSSHEYAESPSSGKTAITALRSAACRRSSIVRAALNAGSATRTSGMHTATRAKLWR
jgi:hypothetical protein